jgi:hypothetical protein
MRIVKYQDNRYCVYKGFLPQEVRAMIELYEGHNFHIAFLYRPKGIALKDFDKNNYIKGLIKRHFSHLSKLSVSIIEMGAFNNKGNFINVTMV